MPVMLMQINSNYPYTPRVTLQCCTHLLDGDVAPRPLFSHWSIKLDTVATGHHILVSEESIIFAKTQWMITTKGNAE